MKGKKKNKRMTTTKTTKIITTTSYELDGDVFKLSAILLIGGLFVLISIVIAFVLFFVGILTLIFLGLVIVFLFILGLIIAVGSVLKFFSKIFKKEKK